MSDFINNTPSGIREALDQQLMPGKSEDVRAKMKRLFGLKIPKEGDFEKALKEKDVRQW